MKFTTPTNFPVMAGLLLMAWTVGAQAQTTIIKANTATMNAAADWGGTVPNNTTVGKFDATISSGNEALLNLNGNVTLAGLLFSNNLNGPVIITNTAYTLTLDTSFYTNVAGIDMSVANQNVTFTNAITLKGKQAWKVVAGKTLTLVTAPTTTGAGVDFSGVAGTLGGLTNVNGILGPWATANSGASYATVSGGVVSAYTGGTTLPATGGSATANYTNNAGVALTGECDGQHVAGNRHRQLCHQRQHPHSHCEWRDEFQQRHADYFQQGERWCEQ